ncbi:OsmC family protein [Roseateles toxinivorans]|uniref:Putative OsmC-like protein n=1 Tax=Roseateles toxinivorans TaxID=270368 RepID=A0A4R6QLY1_9BURK|nr:OsmC family protein [Roseateles toxinivorans]TDP64189.1 putative OsmC-like protein [Roseateles toxinivorans]
MSDNSFISIELHQQQDYRFEARFGAPVAPLVCDEPPPLGAAAGPSPVELLCAAVANCLSDSLLFALRKFKQAPEPLSCKVTAEVGRNAEGRVRVLAMTARLQLGVAAAELLHLERVLSQFESYCTVTQSVGQGIAITVQVWDATGTQLK